jgi:hypothetical protein
MDQRLVRFGVRSRKLSKVVARLLDGLQKFIITSSSVFQNVKPLVPAAFAVVSSHQSALGPRGGISVLPLSIHKERLCPSNGDINRLMMILL